MVEKGNETDMTFEEFRGHILRHFGFAPTADQSAAIEVFTRFLARRDGMPAMIMRGSAGTGKTSLVAAMVKTLLALKQKVVLLAPTGRAAKVLAQNCNMQASTIHRKIYRQKTGGMDFGLDINLHTDTLFVVDEASMISTVPQTAQDGMPVFNGNGGGLIDDLVTYVYSGRNCRLMLVGDKAQLPPVGDDEAPALQRDIMGCYGLDVSECDLDEVVRQSVESGILCNATNVRNMITHEASRPGGGMEIRLPKIRFSGFTDIVAVPGNELIESLEESYYRMGQDETIVITRSNKTATIYNNGIRARVVDHEGELSSGDRIMVVKNHYFDVSPSHSEGKGETSTAASSRSEATLPSEGMGEAFIANGDMAVVRRVRKVREMYGFRFADLTLQFPDYDDAELEMTAILDTLQSDAPALTAEQNRQLYERVMEDYMDLPRKADRQKAMKKDRYYNALQIKFAYAVTCHKAQGGQWSHVYVDQGYMTDDMLTPDYLHWLYTALTRATRKLFLVNWRKEQTM